MSDPYFLCYRCKQHKLRRLLSTHVSPSGKPCCVSCEGKFKLPKGVSASKAPKRLSKANADYIASTLR